MDNQYLLMVDGQQKEFNGYGTGFRFRIDWEYCPDAISKIGYKVIGVDIHEKFSNEDDENLINTYICDATNEKETKKFMENIFSKHQLMLTYKCNGS